MIDKDTRKQIQEDFDRLEVVTEEIRKMVNQKRRLEYDLVDLCVRAGLGSVLKIDLTKLKIWLRG